MRCCLGSRDRNDILEYHSYIISNRESENIFKNKALFIGKIFKNLNNLCISFKLSKIVSQLKINYKNSIYFKKKNSKKERIKKEMKLMQGMLEI